MIKSDFLFPWHRHQSSWREIYWHIRPPRRKKEREITCSHWLSPLTNHWPSSLDRNIKLRLAVASDFDQFGLWSGDATIARHLGLAWQGRGTAKSWLLGVEFRADHGPRKSRAQACSRVNYEPSGHSEYSLTQQLQTQISKWRRRGSTSKYTQIRSIRIQPACKSEEKSTNTFNLTTRVRAWWCIAWYWLQIWQ